MQRLKPILKWSLILAVILGVIWGGNRLFGKQSGDTESADLSQVVVVERGSLTASITPTGEVYVTSRADLTFDVNGVELIELFVEAGQPVKEGDVLARIDSATLELALNQASANLLHAEDTLESALEPYTELDRENAELAVARAEVTLEQAKEALDEVLNPDIETAEKVLRQAEYSLENAILNLKLTETSYSVGKNVRDLKYAVSWHERDYNNQKTRYDQGKIDAETLGDKWEELDNLQKQLTAAETEAQSRLTDAEDSVSKAEEDLIEAQKELEYLRTGPDALELAQVRSNLDQAEYGLARAQNDLETILAGSQTKDIELAQASYDSAVASFEEAQEALENATMVAPFDGTIIRTGAEVGDTIHSGKVIVTVANLNELEIMASIDESDITKVEAGQKATITFDAFPGLRFQGEVLEVPLEGNLQSSIVTYEVPLSLEGAEDVNITPGMTANLTIIVGQTEDALLVSALAIQQGEEGNVVMVQESPGGEFLVTPVQVGLSNNLYVEILRGLNEGDQILVRYEAEEEAIDFRDMGKLKPPPDGRRPSGK